MADVFVANDTRTGRRVALKLVPIGDDQEARQIVEAEREGAEYQKQLWQVYRQVPEVYQYGTDGSYFYIAMEFLDGQNLSEVIAGGALPAPRALGIAIQICRFLEAAHTLEPTIDGRKRRSLLHGDLKPRNIRVLNDDEVKVFDFGAAKALSFSRKVTRHDFGSIAYLSPERIESGDIDAHADFWGVGVILYEMVSGMQPFQAKDTRRLESMIRCAPSSSRAQQRLSGRPPGGRRQASRRRAARPLRQRAGDSRGSRMRAAPGARRSPSAKAGPRACRTSLPRGASVQRQRDRAGTDDEEATRRTLEQSRPATQPPRPAEPAAHGPARVAGDGKPSTVRPPVIRNRRSRLRRVLRVALLLLAFAIVANELRISCAGAADWPPRLPLWT